MSWLSRFLDRAVSGDMKNVVVQQKLLDVEELEERIVPSLLGQQLFPSDYPWNQNIANAPVASNSGSIIAHIGTGVTVHPDWGNDSPSNGDSPLYGIPVNIVHGNSVAKINVSIDNYPGESDIEPVPIPANAVIEGDYQNGPNPNGAGYNSGQRGDSHLIIWDEDNNIAYELYGVSRPSDALLFPNADTGAELPNNGEWHAAQETVWNMSTDTFRSIGYTSADAAGLSILAGLARPDEGLPVANGGQGAIDHALRFTLPSGDVLPQYIYPASHMVSTSGGPNNLPLGARLRLENNTTVDALIAKMGPEAQIIATAMQQYGLVLADIGSAMYVTGSSASVNANNDIDLVWNMNDVLGLETLTAADFQVVNLTPIVTSLSSSSGPAGNTITINGQNFSGAAGQLSVLFNTVASKTVTFISDTQITAVVPSGSGTVNVTVQSGKYEIDNWSDNPNANVNAPIFGYGTSAVVATGQFTYTPISGSNSTVTLTKSTVASGSTDTVAIVAEDGSGNAVSGLASSAFSFSFSGGTSTGTIGNVTETSTPGTYTATLTGAVAGTVATLNTSIGGQAITSTPPTLTVTPGPVSLSRSVVTASSGSVQTGNTITITLQTEDADGNKLTSGGLTVVFNLASGQGGQGTFGSVVDHNNGTYTVTFTGTTSGKNTFTTTVGGQAVTSTQPTITVIGTVSLATSIVVIGNATLGFGARTSVELIARDSSGNQEPTGGLSVLFFVSGGSGQGTLSAVTDNGNGTYSALFTGNMAGNVSLSAKIGGQSITSSAPTVTVQSIYAGPAYNYAYLAYAYAYNAYAAGAGSYTAYKYAYDSFYFAYYANYYISIGDGTDARNYAYYAYYYGYLGSTYAYQDYFASGQTSLNSYYAYYYGFFDWNYSYDTYTGL